MKQELAMKLQTNHAELFKNGCSLDCGDGWYNIIDVLSYNIESHIKNLISSAEWAKKNNSPRCVTVLDNVRYSRIKEKYGTLRVYTDGTDNEINGMITMAESMSGRTCEVCGAPGKSRNGSWIRTLCNQHFMADALDAPDSFMCDDE